MKRVQNIGDEIKTIESELCSEEIRFYAVSRNILYWS